MCLHGTFIGVRRDQFRWVGGGGGELMRSLSACIFSPALARKSSGFARIYVFARNCLLEKAIRRGGCTPLVGPLTRSLGSFAFTAHDLGPVR